MTFLTFEAADIFYGYAVHFTGFDIVMEFFVNALKFISLTIAVVKIHFCIAVAVYTPAHAQF